MPWTKPRNRSAAKAALRFLLWIAFGVYLVQARPRGPWSVTGGSYEANGRSVSYSVADGELEYLLILDQPWWQGAERASFGDEMWFERADGRKLNFHSPTRERFAVIDGREYRREDGSVFLVTVTPEGNRCRQVPARFEAGIPYPDVEPHVRDRLGHAAREYPEVRAFLGRGG